MTNQAFFTMTELQEWLNRGDRRSLREQIQASDIPCVEFGRETIIRTAAFVSWLKRHERIALPAKRKGRKVQAIPR